MYGPGYGHLGWWHYHPAPIDTLGKREGNPFREGERYYPWLYH